MVNIPSLNPKQLLKDFGKTSGATLDDEIMRDSLSATADIFNEATIEEVTFDYMLTGGKAAELIYYGQAPSRNSDDADILYRPYLTKSKMKKLLHQISDILDEKYSMEQKNLNWKYALDVKNSDKEITLSFLKKSQPYLNKPNTQLAREISNAKPRLIPRTSGSKFIKSSRAEDVIASKLFNNMPKHWYDIKLVLNAYAGEMDKSYLKTAISDNVRFFLENGKNEENIIDVDSLSDMYVKELLPE